MLIGVEVLAYWPVASIFSNFLSLSSSSFFFWGGGGGGGGGGGVGGFPINHGKTSFERR
jgi:hypothetical protein